MNLHDDKKAFQELIIATSNELSIPANIVEKDYYVTIVLKLLANKIDGMVFKGGTSLTKCYQILDRFSEDIDISYDAELGAIGEGKKRKLKNNIVATMNELNLPIYNLEDTRSRRYYNCYKAHFPSFYENNNVIKSELIIETYVALLPFPTTKRYIDNYIYRCLLKLNRLDLAKEYNLVPFEITTQAIERTFVDKVLALCDYYMQGKIAKHSRHLYDIYKIFNNVEITNEIKELISQVKAQRSKLDICPSAKDGVRITDVLKEIVEKQIYENDYKEITANLLFVPVTYEETIECINKIISDGIFD